MNTTRRALLQKFSLATAALAFGSPRLAAADEPPEQDWQWLVGNWDVWHERLRERLVGSTTWDKFAGKSNCWLTLGGLGTIDDNLLHLPSGKYRAVGVRAFDPASRQWAIWWLDGRMAGKLDPPVRGGFDGSEGEFRGADVHKGTPVTVRFRWHETHGKRPHWDQAFSTNDGKDWEINWRNYFTRTAAAPSPLPLEPGETGHAAAADWRFLVGDWKVRNRRRTAEGSWEEFDSTLSNRPVMGGLGNVGDNVFHAPSGTYRGVSLRAYDPAARCWNTWWLDGRKPLDIVPSASGGFKNGVGTLVGDEGDRKVRVTWSNITHESARWEQATSADGRSWVTNWTADLERAGA